MAGLLTLLRDWLSAPDSRPPERRSTLANPDDELVNALTLGGPTATGIHVTPDRAMQLSAVWACVRLIAETVASLPLEVYRRLPDGGRERAADHPMRKRLHSEPNETMTSFVAREMLATQLLLTGNCYAPILRTFGNVEDPEILPVPSRGVRVRRATSGELVYDVTLPDGKTLNPIPQANMLHVPGLSFDGVLGVSPIRYAAQSIGLGLAAEQYGASFFGNGSTPAGYIKVPGSLNPEQAKAMREAWYAAYGGLRNANRTAVLFENAEFHRTGVPPEEAQFIQTRKLQAADIARWYRVPLHMIGELDRATFSNIEHQQLEFVTHTLRPWLVRFEQELNRKLFPSRTTGEPNALYCEFNVDGLLRGDIKTRGDYYVRGRQWGWLSVNDIRRRENMEPVDGGDVYLTPLNMVRAGDEPGRDPAADPAADPASDGTGDGTGDRSANTTHKEGQDAQQ